MTISDMAAKSITSNDRRKFKSPTSDNMDTWKGRGGKGQRRERKKKKIRRERQKTEDPGAQKGKRVAKHCVDPMFCGPGGSKSRLAKAAVAESSCQLNDQK